MRRLIINADDFGLTSGVNRAIADAHTRGLVTSATLMAGGPAVEEAIRIALGAPHLSTGCHVVLVDGSSLLAAREIPTLAAKPDSQGARFRNRLNGFAVRALMARLNPEEIEAEAVAQISRLQAAGIAVSHLDTHKHTHMFPVVRRALLRAARTCGVMAVRNPFAPSRPMPFLDLSRRPTLWKRYVETRALRLLATGFRREVTQAGMFTTDGSFGIIETGALDLDLFEDVVASIPDGTWEFVCHPGYNDADLGRVGTRLRDSRLRELEALTSDRARLALEQRGIELITYRDLVAKMQAPAGC